jgi:hypothetical protein
MRLPLSQAYLALANVLLLVHVVCLQDTALNARLTVGSLYRSKLLIVSPDYHLPPIDLEKRAPLPTESKEQSNPPSSLSKVSTQPSVPLRPLDSVSNSQSSTQIPQQSNEASAQSKEPAKLQRVNTPLSSQADIIKPQQEKKSSAQKQRLSVTQRRIEAKKARGRTTQGTIQKIPYLAKYLVEDTKRYLGFLPPLPASPKKVRFVKDVRMPLLLIYIKSC